MRKEILTMGSRRTFDEWIGELREIVRERFEVSLDDMPEFDLTDARSYFRDKSPPSLYFKECLEEFGEAGDRLREILPEARIVP